MALWADGHAGVQWSTMAESEVEQGPWPQTPRMSDVWRFTEKVC